MTDLAERACTRMAELLEAQRAAIAHHAGLLQAQRAALRSDDLELLSEIAGEAAHVLERLEVTSRHLVVGGGPPPGASGPRSDLIRSLLVTVAVELDRAYADLRQFTEAVQERRARLIDTLAEDRAGVRRRPGNGFRAAPPGPAFLDRSG
jgi:hypothetical protein